MNETIKTGARFISGKLLPKVSYPVIKGPLKGAKFILGSSIGPGAGASIFFNTSEPAQTFALTEVLGSNQVFFDIGANIGYYTILGSRIVGPKGKVLAFEPVPRNLSFIYRHAILNKARNVNIIPAACSDKSALTIVDPANETVS